MIKNEREFRITHSQAEKFRTAIATAAREGPPKGVAPKLHQVSIEGMRAQLKDLDRELLDYKTLQDPKGKVRLEDSADALGALLIKARIARGWSQRELAERLGLQMQKIQQYEATEYAGASVTRVREILQALGVTARVQLQVLELPASLATSAPAGKETDSRRRVRGKTPTS